MNPSRYSYAPDLDAMVRRRGVSFPWFGIELLTVRAICSARHPSRLPSVTPGWKGVSVLISGSLGIYRSGLGLAGGCGERRMGEGGDPARWVRIQPQWFLKLILESDVARVLRVRLGRAGNRHSLVELQGDQAFTTLFARHEPSRGERGRVIINPEAP